MSDDKDNYKTKSKSEEFDFSAYPADTVFHERRTGRERRHDEAPKALPEVEEKPRERRAKKERRKRIDPTTFEKQYTEEELEFMTAMQKFKESSHKQFPSYGEVLKVAVRLGYRRVVIDDDYPTGPPKATATADMSVPATETKVLIGSHAVDIESN